MRSIHGIMHDRIAVDEMNRLVLGGVSHVLSEQAGRIRLTCDDHIRGSTHNRQICSAVSRGF